MEEPTVGSIITYIKPRIYEKACNNLGEEFKYNYEAHIVECVNIVEQEYSNHTCYHDLKEHYQQLLNQIDRRK
jgi:hypothetical protein